MTSRPIFFTNVCEDYLIIKLFLAVATCSDSTSLSITKESKATIATSAAKALAARPTYKRMPAFTTSSNHSAVTYVRARLRPTPSCAATPTNISASSRLPVTVAARPLSPARICTATSGRVMGVGCTRANTVPSCSSRGPSWRATRPPTVARSRRSVTSATSCFSAGPT